MVVVPDPAVKAYHLKVCGVSPPAPLLATTVTVNTPAGAVTVPVTTPLAELNPAGSPVTANVEAPE